MKVYLSLEAIDNGWLERRRNETKQQQQQQKIRKV